MRTVLFLVLFSILSNYCLGQIKVRFGLTASPLISWMKADASEIQKNKIRGGIEYGLLLDLNFTKNYALSTGINFSHVGGNVKYTESLLFFNTGDSTFIPDTKARFKIQYFNLPIVFKLKTNEIGYITYYGSFGLVTSFRVSARVDIEGTDFQNENIIKRKDETGIFQSTFFNVSLYLGGGIEYALNDKTALLVGIFYKNGFMNTVKDGDNDKILIHNIGLKVGILF